MRWIALVVLAACSKGKTDDCAIVRDKPADAMAELSKRYPNNPIKVAQTIESCVAPSGDECERLSKVILAIPTMAPQVALPKSAGSAGDVVRMCQTSPPEFRRCLLPSYGLAHADECREAVTKATTQIEITPSAKRTDPLECSGLVALYVDSRGVWLATGKEPTARCFAPRNRDALDVEWLENELKKLRVKLLDCGIAVELAVADTVAYRELIAVMDIAVKVGLSNVGLTAASELSVPLAAADPNGASRTCPASTIAQDPSAPAHDVDMGTDLMRDAPVLIITKTKLTLKAGVTSTDIATVDEAKSPTAKLDALTKLLPPTRVGVLILQADEATPTTVINRVITTAKAAGYDNVLFAVKNR